MDAIIAQALRQAGDDTPIRERAAVGGGSINQALRLRTARGEYLLKIGGRGLPGFFAAEARGLALLAGTGTVRVPAVLAYGEPRTENQEPRTISSPDIGSQLSVLGSEGYILLEWLAAPPHANRARASEQLGAGLAELHRTLAAVYGLDQDNYIGATLQPNGVMDRWLMFFRDRRLGYQAELARRNGRMTGQRAQHMDQLLGRLGEWIDDRAVQPALLHGDLWGGNFIVGPGGAPALIDPAVYYGDREADLAMTRLFGGFPAGFYQAYAAAWPLAAGWRERVDLYNLYHLLNHLNLFGEGYGTQVDATLVKYVG